jgi:hypothetical protein
VSGSAAVSARVVCPQDDASGAAQSAMASTEATNAKPDQQFRRGRAAAAPPRSAAPSAVPISAAPA